MKRSTLIFSAGIAVALTSFYLPSLGFGQTRAETPPAQDSVKVGVAETMVVGVPDLFVGILGDRLGALMKEFSGVGAKLEVGGCPFTLARNLEEGKVDLAFFQGLEYAWVQAKHPGLRPLMLVINKETKVYAQLMVRADAGTTRLADLRGKDIVCPEKNRAHCRTFLEASCFKCGERNPKAFFGKVVTACTTEKALDELAAGTVQAVLADKAEIDFYNRVKPGDFAKLKALETSGPFPTGVVVCRKGALGSALLERVRKGMLRANDSERGQDLMASWQITGFQAVPEDYQRSLEEIVRTYPAPEESLSSRR